MINVLSRLPIHEESAFAAICECEMSMFTTRKRESWLHERTMAPLQKVTPDQAMQAACPLALLLTVAVCVWK